MINVHSAEIEKRFRAMSDHELAEVRPTDFTPVAVNIYERELTRRFPDFAEELLERNRREAEPASSRAIPSPPDDPRPCAGLSEKISFGIFIFGCVVVLSLLASGVEAGRLAGTVASLCLPGIVRFSSLLQRQRAWDNRHKTRQS